MTKELNEQELKEISGGAIDDSTLKNVLGYNWSELSSALGSFLTAASNAGFSSEVSTINSIIANKDINFLKIASYKAAIKKLYPFAINNNYTEAANVLSAIAALLGMSL